MLAAHPFHEGMTLEQFSAAIDETGGAPVKQISSKVSRKSRAEAVVIITRYLERTAWSKGGAILSTHNENRVVASWPGARPAQLRAGARKLYDVKAAQVRREQLDAPLQFDGPAPEPTPAARSGRVKPLAYSKPTLPRRNALASAARTLLTHGKRLFSRKGGAK